MAFKVFLDANVLLDFTLQRENYESAKKLMQKGIGGIIQLFTTPSVLHITSYWLSKYYGNAKARQLLLALLADVQTIDCNYETVLMALHSSIDDIEDALQYYTALNFDLDYFISSDKKLKKAAIPQLPVYEIEEFLKELDKNED